MAKKRKVVHRNFVALAAHLRNGGKMDPRPRRLRTRKTQRDSALRDQE